MKGNPFYKFTPKQVRKILRKGKINGHPITPKQLYHLQKIAYKK